MNFRFVSVIVTTFNRTNLLERNIKSLLNQTLEVDVKMEIIIVDDCSIQEYKDKIYKLVSQSSQIKLVENAVNMGLSCSRNAGASHAKGDFLLFLDDDIIVENTYVMGHLNVLSSQERVASVGSLRFPPELTLSNNLMKYLSSRELRQRQFNQSILTDLTPQFFGGGICGICLNDFKRIGGFNEVFKFYGGEDVQMGSALKNSGVRLVYACEARADHFDAVEIERYRSKYMEAAREGYLLIHQENPNFFDNSSVRFLLPSNKDAKISDKLISLILKLILNSFFEILLYKFVKRTNRINFLYNKYLYHLLFACWMSLGLRKKTRTNNSQVHYSNN
jgi:GT2 family glycosyltransferase